MSVISTKKEERRKEVVMFVVVKTVDRCWGKRGRKKEVANFEGEIWAGHRRSRGGDVYVFLVANTTTTHAHTHYDGLF